MRDDEAEDGEKHNATTVPPPAGEADIYEAKTQVGGLPPEAMEMLRALRDEAPSKGAGKEANVPIFVDEEPVSNRPRPAAGLPARPAAAPAASTAPRPGAGAPTAPRAAVAASAAVRPAPSASVAKPSPEAPPPAAPTPPSSVPHLENWDADPPAPPIASLAINAPPVQAVASPASPIIAAETESYESVFAPLPPSTATPEVASPQPAAAPSSPAPMTMLVFAMGAVIALLVIGIALMARSGLVPGVNAQPSAPASH